VEIFSSQGAPPVSTTPVANFATSSVSVIDTGGKFLIEDFFHLPPVTTTLAVHLELRISPRIYNH
jgi:hypothetical protein